MNVGEVISALIKYASDWNRDNLLLLRSVNSIDVCENTQEIEICFTDGNTRDVVIDMEGRFLRFTD